MTANCVEHQDSPHVAGESSMPTTRIPLSVWAHNCTAELRAEGYSEAVMLV